MPANPPAIIPATTATGAAAPFVLSHPRNPPSPALQPYQQRLLQERTELNQRMERLIEFINSSPAYRDLLLEEQNLLAEQYLAMRDYRNILDRRIDRFNGGSQC